MKKSKALLVIIIIFWVIRDNVPYVTGILPLPIIMIALAISYIAFIAELGIVTIQKYFLLFSVPFANLIFSLFNSNEGGFDVLFYGFLQSFIWVFICEFLLKHKQDKGTTLIFFVLLFSFIVTSATTYYGNLQFPGASRMMATGLNDDRELAATFGRFNIGGFGFIYSLVLMLPLFFFIMRFFSEGILKKAVSLAIIALFLLTIYQSEYTTALLFSAIAISILFLPSKLSVRSIVFILLAFIPIIVISFTSLPSLFLQFSQSTDSYNMSVRMEELGYIMDGNQGYGDVQGRINVWMWSLNNFINNLLTGTGNGGGGHSFVLDTMSKYGIWGLVLVILQFSSTYKIFVKPYTNSNYFTPVLFVFIINICLSIFNTIFFYNLFLVILPLFWRFIERRTIQADI